MTIRLPVHVHIYNGGGVSGSASDIFSTPGSRVKEGSHLGPVLLVPEGEGLLRHSQSLQWFLKFLLSHDHTGCPFTFHCPEQVPGPRPASGSCERDTAVYKASFSQGEGERKWENVTQV